VLLSSQAVGTRPGVPAYAPMAAIEAAVTQSGLEWTILRAGGLADATLAILGRPTPAEARVSPDAESVLGRPGRSFTDWAQRNAAAFR